jgi:hypothetical protein
MKNSTILIVVGIMIMIVGGIVFMNNGQTENKSAPTYNKIATERLTEVLDNDLHRGSSRPISIPTPIAIIVFGMVVLVAGAYDARRTPSMGNTKRPGTN